MRVESKNEGRISPIQEIAPPFQILYHTDGDKYWKDALTIVGFGIQLIGTCRAADGLSGMRGDVSLPAIGR